MTTAQLIKSNGFQIKRIDTSKFKGVFGGTCNHVVALLNDKEEILCYEGRPYFPAGKNKTFASLIQNGNISAPCFSFKSLR